MCILLVCSGSDTVIRLYDGSGTLKARVDNAQIENYGCSFNYHREFFATGSFASDTKVYHITRANTTYEYQRFAKEMSLAGPHGSVFDVSFDQHDRVGVVSKDGSFYLWTVDVRYWLQEDPHLLNSVELGKVYHHILLHPLQNLAVAVDGTEALIFDPTTGERKGEISTLCPSVVTCIDASPAGDLFAVLGSEEKQVVIWRFS